MRQTTHTWQRSEDNHSSTGGGEGEGERRLQRRFIERHKRQKKSKMKHSIEEARQTNERRRRMCEECARGEEQARARTASQARLTRGESKHTTASDHWRARAHFRAPFLDTPKLCVTLNACIGRLDYLFTYRTMIRERTPRRTIGSG